MKNKNNKTIYILLLTLLFPLVLNATFLDFAVQSTDSPNLFQYNSGANYINSIGSIGIGDFAVSDPTNGSGSGSLNSFLRIQNGPSEQGYNYQNNNAMPMDDKSGVNFPLFGANNLGVNGGKVTFVLDLQESNSVDARLISLDEIQIFVTSQPNQFLGANDFTGAGLLALQNASLVYRMDGGGINSSILLDSKRNGGGNGTLDLYFQLSLSAFTDVIGANPNYQSIIFYSKFGDTSYVLQSNGAYTMGGAIKFNSKSSFEEWSSSLALVVPEYNCFWAIILTVVPGLYFNYKKFQKGK